MLNDERVVVGALLIVCGAVLSCFSTGGSSSSSGGGAGSFPPAVVLPSILLYASSNIPMASSSVYKESAFDKTRVDVWYLTQWVSVYQFFLSFLFLPLSPGRSSSDQANILGLGWRCYTGQIRFCAEHSMGFLLFAYTGVNIVFNTLGLYLTKHTSAALNSISYSVLLPLNTALYFTPFVPGFLRMTWHYPEGYFLEAGMLLVLVGFAVFQLFMNGRLERVGGPLPSTPPRR